MKRRMLRPVHPGEVLNEEFLVPMGITQYRLAKDIRIPSRRINEIVLGKRGISADTALRLARYFSTSADVWMNLQNRYEVEMARMTNGETIERQISPLAEMSPSLAAMP